MTSKPSRLALSGLALVCAAIFAACNCAPTLRYVTVAPSNGTIYVSAPPDAGVKGARRGAREFHGQRRVPVRVPAHRAAVKRP